MYQDFQKWKRQWDGILTEKESHLKEINKNKL